MIEQNWLRELLLNVLYRGECQLFFFKGAEWGRDIRSSWSQRNFSGIIRSHFVNMTQSVVLLRVWWYWDNNSKREFAEQLRCLPSFWYNFISLCVLLSLHLTFSFYSLSASHFYSEVMVVLYFDKGYANHTFSLRQVVVTLWS